MARRRKFVNPFFLLLGIAGGVFAVSAVVYGIMVLRFSHGAGNWAEQEPREGLLLFFRQHGTMVLLIELAVLGILAVAAIWTDDYWIRRSGRRSSDPSDG